MSRMRATFVGFGAVLLWALLAVLTVQAGPVPPFLLASLSLAIGGLVGVAWTARSGRGLAPLRGVRPVVWLVGIAGIFGYHFFYFTALSLAPAAQASLIAYLWPLLIVLLSGLLPGERLRPLHLVGAVLALAGAALILLPGVTGAAGSAAGYLSALGCAVTWALYSVASRRLGETPTETVTIFCLASTLLAALAHLALETTVWPQGPGAWVAVALLGLGPVGLAFYLWDVGVKRGDIQLLGTMSYAAPLLSTLILVLAGAAEPTANLAAAALLIAGGAALAARAGRRAPQTGKEVRPDAKGAGSLP
jgi:drug/metabolite transporter (DMT)-like permease